MCDICVIRKILPRYPLTCCYCIPKFSWSYYLLLLLSRLESMPNCIGLHRFVFVFDPPAGERKKRPNKLPTLALFQSLSLSLSLTRLAFCCEIVVVGWGLSWHFWWSLSPIGWRTKDKFVYIKKTVALAFFAPVSELFSIFSRIAIPGSLWKGFSFLLSYWAFYQLPYKTHKARNGHLREGGGGGTGFFFFFYSLYFLLSHSHSLLSRSPSFASCYPADEELAEGGWAKRARWKVSPIQTFLKTIKVKM